MYKDKKFLGIIPARGGSKRLLKKNKLPLNGKPLIEWSIQAAIDSKFIDKIIVSSDDLDILSIAEALGVESQLRPEDLSTSSAGTVGVINHVIEQVKQQYDYIVLLQPTSPLRNSKHIDEAIRLILEKSANSVVSVSQAEHSPLWCNTLPDDGLMNDFISKSIEGKRSQDLENYYCLNGAIYIVNIKAFSTSESLMSKDIYAYIMTQESSIDIDTMYDFVCAEAIMRYNEL